MSEVPEITQPRKLKYIPAFDGLRGVFCLINVSHHLPVFFFRTPFALAWESLQVFFMMSGYLITMILLNDKAKYGFKDYSKRFYLKRFYRIFPLYFAYLFIMLLLGYLTRNMSAAQPLAIWPELKQNWAYLFSYTYNLKEFLSLKSGLNYNISPVFAHLWSLSLEEQFYIFFPLLVFFLSEKNLKRLMIGVVIISPLIRAFGYFYLSAHIPAQMPDIPNYNKEVLVGWILHHNTFFQMDVLSMGVCLALFNFDWIKKPLLWFIALGILFLSLIVFNGMLDVHNGLAPTLREAIMSINVLSRNYQAIYMFTLGNILVGLLILISFQKNNPFKIFEWKFFVNIGRISYGIYVYHFFILATYFIIIKMLGIRPQLYSGHFFRELPVVLGYYFVLILLAKLSFRYFESYFLNLKAKIDSNKSAEKKPAVT